MEAFKIDNPATAIMLQSMRGKVIIVPDDVWLNKRRETEIKYAMAKEIKQTKEVNKG